MKYLFGVACAAVIAGTPAHSASNSVETALKMVTPYCAFTYSDGNKASECLHVQSMALVRLAALKKVRGDVVDNILLRCVAGQYPEPGSGVNFVDAFKCVSARIPSN